MIIVIITIIIIAIIAIISITIIIVTARRQVRPPSWASAACPRPSRDLAASQAPPPNKH